LQLIDEQLAIAIALVQDHVVAEKHQEELEVRLLQVLWHRSVDVIPTLAQPRQQRKVGLDGELTQLKLDLL
jgi:hypothetical protein